MSQVCRIVVTTGPERGKVFELEGELVHIGRAPENQIVLEDPGLSDHQATILHKNGRFAIFRPDEADVEVDGSNIPAQQWVWLPTEARLQFGRRTSCQFNYEPLTAGVTPPPAARPASKSETGASHKHADRAGQKSSEAGASTRIAVKPPPLPAGTAADDSGVDDSASQTKSQNGRSRGKSAERKKKKKREKHVARFITDQGGPMVELGADGHLPELALQDGPGTKTRRATSRSSSPVLLYGILGLSMAACLAMLLIDPTPQTVTETSKSVARRELVRFFGMSEEQIAQREREIKRDPKVRWPWPSGKKPVGLMGPENVPARWQKDLRAARIARTRGDYAAERAAYRQVLDELNAEDHDLHFGLTGDPGGDRELKRLVSIAISR